MKKTIHNYRDTEFVRYNKWTVLKDLGFNNLNKKIVLCRCDCGNEKIKILTLIKNGRNKQCSKCRYKYGGFKEGVSVNGKKTPEYISWTAMKTRCRIKKGYFDRGITYEDRWKKFEEFYKDMGKKPFKNATLGRINNNKGYSKDNCRWEDTKQQSRNTQRTILIKYKEKQMCIADWSKELDIPYSTIYSRYNKKLSTAEIFYKGSLLQILHHPQDSLLHK